MQYSSNEEGSLLHFLILCGENKYAAGGGMEEIYRKDKQQIVQEERN